MATRSHNRRLLPFMAAAGLLIISVGATVMGILATPASAQECAPAALVAGDVHTDDVLALAEALVASTPTLKAYIDPKKVQSFILDRPNHLIYIVVDGQVCHGVLATDAQFDDWFKQALGVRV